MLTDAETSALRAALTSSDVTARRKALLRIAEGNLSLPIEEIAASVVSHDSTVRQAAASALGGAARGLRNRARDELLRLLKDRDPLVRGEAIAALRLTGARDASPAIRHVLITDEDWMVRADAAEALGELGDADSLIDLERALADPHFTVRSYAALSIGLVATPSLGLKFDAWLMAETHPATKLELTVAALRAGREDLFEYFLCVLRSADDETFDPFLNAVLDLAQRRTPRVVFDEQPKLLSVISDIVGKYPLGDGMRAQIVAALSASSGAGR